MKFQHRKFIVLGAIGMSLILFQNCEEAFKTNEKMQISQNSESNNGSQPGTSPDSVNDSDGLPGNDSPSFVDNDLPTAEEMAAPFSPQVCLDSPKIELLGHIRHPYPYPVYTIGPILWTFDSQTETRTSRNFPHPGHLHVGGYKFAGVTVNPMGQRISLAEEAFATTETKDGGCYFHSYSWNLPEEVVEGVSKEILFPSEGLYRTENMVPFRWGSPQRFGEQILAPLTLRDTDDPTACDPSKLASFNQDVPAVYNHTKDSIEIYEYSEFQLSNTPFIAEEIKDIALVNGDVYGIGTKYDVNGAMGAPALWKNGRLVEFNPPSGQSFMNVQVESSAGSLYIAALGRDKVSKLYKLYIWKNANLIQTINIESDSPVLVDFSVEMGQHYVLMQKGNSQNRQVYYLANGESKKILDSEEYSICSPLGIKAFANKVYAITACQSDNNKEYMVWIDGIKSNLSFVTPTDIYNISDSRFNVTCQTEMGQQTHLDQ